MAATARYDEVADFYVTEMGAGLDDPGTAVLLDLVGEVGGRRLLDLACGQGRVARELARRGASVTGVDLSAALIEQASAAEEADRLGIEYVAGDAGDDGLLESAAFDGVVCNFGVSDIDDLDAALRTVRRALKPGGFFVLSLLHPCFPGWTENVSASWPRGGGYFAEGWWRSQASRSLLRRQVGSNHRTISTYLNALVRQDLLLESAREPAPPPRWLAENPGMDAVPVFLVLRCLRADIKSAIPEKAGDDATRHRDSRALGTGDPRSGRRSRRRTRGPRLVDPEPRAAQGDAWQQPTSEDDTDDHATHAGPDRP